MKIFAIVAFTAASVIATAATAEPTRTDVPVSYADLNLASPAGQAALARRISIAAKRACDVSTAQSHQAMKMESARCYDDAVSGARIAMAAATATAPQLASR